MVSHQRTTTLPAVALVALLAGVLFSGGAVQAAPDPWPKRFEHPQATVIIYQPQPEDMQDDKLTALAAVSVRKKEWKQPVFGAIWLAGRVVTDRDTRMATIDEVKVTEAKFPEATPEQLAKLRAFLNEGMQGWSTTISLDRLLAALAVVKQEQIQDAGLRHDPPAILFASHPAVLVLLDGEPKLLPIPESPLLQVANTPFVMVYHPGDRRYYLKGGEAWLSAAEVTGPWQAAAPLPAPVKALAEQMKAAAASGTPQGAKSPAKKEVQTTAGRMPEVIVSTVPAELLVTDGEPQFTPISGTGLLFVSNTESNIFMNTASQEYFTLLSGRWFRSTSLKEGPWSYVAPNQLPGDFAQIPPASAKGFIRVNVAGTAEAQEAVLDNHLPQTAAIDRRKATTQVKYAGAPSFAKIPDNNLEYAVNTGKSVFKEGTTYYAVDQGVWYEATSPTGPWRVCVKPPQEVNRIPPSNPHYAAKYVKVYEATEDVAYVGYTPGYTGSYVDNGTVVYGTGYTYPAYTSAEAYIPPPAPPTYGYAATYDPYASTWGYQPSYYNPYTWLAPGLVGFGAGMLTGYAIWGSDRYYGSGWWGSGGYNYNNVNINHNYLNNRTWNAGDRWAGARPGTGAGAVGIRPGVGARPTPYRNNIYNRPGTQNLLASRPGGPATRPASAVAGARTGPAGDRMAARPGQGTGRPGERPAARPAPPAVKPAGGKNNVVADRNGNVYRRDNQGNLQQRQGNQWSPAGGGRPGAGARAEARPAARPSPPTARPSDLTQRGPRPDTRHQPRAEAPRPSPRPDMDAHRLNREFQARDRGEARTQQFQRAQSSPAFGGGGGGFSRPGGGGGGFQGGGGGRGGGRGGRR